MEPLHAESLSEVAGGPRELLVLLERLAEAGRALVVEDVGLDTRTESGRRMVALVRELDRLARAGGPPRGRPGLGAHDPKLAAEIAALREAGRSLQAIADELNRRAVPTPRGGAKWRPSSVQAALGYKRPPPPAWGLRDGPRRPRPPGGPGPGHSRPGPKPPGPEA